jgi:hypothetical protein
MIVHLTLSTLVIVALMMIIAGMLIGVSIIRQR